MAAQANAIAQLRLNGLAQSDFNQIYNLNLFGCEESRSGSGSTLEQTATIRLALPKLFAQLGIKEILDVPCGDFNWMRHVDMAGLKYIGGDIVPEMIKKNKEQYDTENIKFQVLDVIHDDLPKADLVFCRDCLVHLSMEDAIKAVENFKRCGAKYLLVTTFPRHEDNMADFRYWRPLNMEIAPFDLGKPMQLFNESCTEVHSEQVG